MNSNPNCIFCRIVLGEAPAAIVHDDAQCMAFMDVMPQSSGHVLVIPKKHAETIYDVDADEAAMLIRQTHRIASAIRKAIQPGGLMIAQYNGALAGQTVGHIHFHLIPRYAGVDLKGHAAVLARPGDLAVLRERILAALPG